MSKTALFPTTRPISDPPPIWESLHMGRSTPLYALAWVCKSSEYLKRRPEITECDLTRPIRAHWFSKYSFTRALCPDISLGSDDNYYLVAMLNQSSYTGFVERSQDPDDELMAAARDVFGITEDLEPTLQWYRYPVDWAEYNPYGL